MLILVFGKNISSFDEDCLRLLFFETSSFWSFLHLLREPKGDGGVFVFSPWKRQWEEGGKGKGRKWSWEEEGMVGEEGTIPSPVRWLAEPPSYGRQGDLIDDLMDTTLRKEEERGGEGGFPFLFFPGEKALLFFSLKGFL